MNKVWVVASCFIVLCGCESQRTAPPKEAQTLPAAQGRFVPTGSDPAVALDTLTGRLCRTVATAPGSDHVDLPLCEAGEPERVAEVNLDVKEWENPDVDVTCSGREHILTSYPMDGKGQKEVTLNCVVKNLTSKVIAIADPHKVDALLRLQDGRVLRVANTYLGSSQREIPARGEVRQAGLWLSNKTCPKEISDQQCVQTVLMKANELFLTDTSNGVRYHVRVD